MAFLCVDVGATNTLLGIGNGHFDITEKIRTDRFLSDIEKHVNQALEEVDRDAEEIEEVAAAVAGPIDRETGVFYPPNIETDHVQIMDPLEKFGDVMIINDCTSAVLGEYHYGEHDSKDLVYVTISSGIGSGVIMDGELIEGAQGNAGEVGHIQLTEKDLGKGGKNHWESMCSGNNMPFFAENLTGKSFENAREIFDLYEDRDCDAREVIEEMKEINARGFASIVNMYNPDKIVVGGAVALNHPEKVVKPLQDAVEDKTVNEVPDIELCALEEEPVLHGLRAACNGKTSL
jgi:glucokinase